MRSLGAVVNICDAWRHAKTPSSPSIPSFFWGPDHLKRSLAKSLPAVHDLHLPSFSVKRILLLETNCTHVIGRSFIIGNYWIAKARVCCTLPIICPGSSLNTGGKNSVFGSGSCVKGVGGTPFSVKSTYFSGKSRPWRPRGKVSVTPVFKPSPY